MKVGELGASINQQVLFLRNHECKECPSFCENHQSFQIHLDTGSIVVVKVVMQLNRSSSYIKVWVIVTPDHEGVIGAVRSAFVNVTRLKKVLINGLPYTIGAHVITQLVSDSI